jgi:hypothetical protein
MLHVYYSEIVHRLSISMEFLHWRTRQLFLSEMTKLVYYIDITKRRVHVSSMSVLGGT